MTTYWHSRLWKSSITIAFILRGSIVFAPGRVVLAQIIADETLGNESSVVTPDNIKGVESERISGGAVRGNNLFHSFREFNIGEDKGGYFENPAAIENIFSRVTGSNPSEILGTLGVLGNANLFFINPNGILFGPNASLDLRGSFLATTADSIVFPDEKQFSATNPEAPPLLTVNVQQPIGLEFQGRERTISHQGNLAVDFGQNLALVGGNLILDGGIIFATGGRVELGGLSAAGEIGINADNSLSFSDGIERADVTLTNAAEVDVRAGGGGSITINARNVDISGGELGAASNLRAGIAADSGSPTAQSGDITLKATDTISVSQGSGILNRVEESGVGNAGGINITTANLSLTQGGRVNASTFGVGDARAITIEAFGTILIDGESQAGSVSGIFSRVQGEGNSGGIDITTTNLYLTRGSVLEANTFGAGDAGAITIEASSTISIDGEDRVGFPTAILSQVGGLGNSGGIDITTTDLSLTWGGRVDASTVGVGDAGAITIEASGTISIEGEIKAGFSSGIFSQVGGLGNSGGIDITTTDLSLTRGGRIDANTAGQRDAKAITIEASGTISIEGETQAGVRSGIFSQVVGLGNSGGINITTTNLFLREGGVVTASTAGQGDAGVIMINALGTISADGEDRAGVSSGIFSQVTSKGEGDSKGINITTANLSLTRGGRVDASTFGVGDAGAITIKASDTISIEGEDRAGVSSGIFSVVQGVGDSRGINLTTTDLSLREGGAVNTSTAGQGDAGEIVIFASDAIFAEGKTKDGVSSGIFSRVEDAARGNTQGINITTAHLFVTNDAQISVESLGQAKAGDLTVTSNTLEASSGGQLQTSTSGNFDAGSITLKVADSINLAEEGSGIFANTQKGSTGNGGSIFIDPNTVIIRDSAQIAVNSFGSGIGGNIDLQAGSLTLDKGTITAETTSNQGGDINLTISDLLTLRNNSQITATAGTDEAGGNGGNIVIDAPFIIAVPQENSDIIANAFEGDGGNIIINANGIFGIEFRDRETPLSDITASSEFGRQGEVEINTSGIDPTRGLNNLPQDTVEVEVAESCQTVGGKSTLEFFDIGRGGLPPNPDDLFSSEIVIAEWIPLALVDEKKQAPTSKKSFTGDKIKNMTLLANFTCQSK